MFIPKTIIIAGANITEARVSMLLELLKVKSNILIKVMNSDTAMYLIVFSEVF